MLSLITDWCCPLCLTALSHGFLPPLLCQAIPGVLGGAHGMPVRISTDPEEASLHQPKRKWALTNAAQKKEKKAEDAMAACSGSGCVPYGLEARLGSSLIMLSVVQAAQQSGPMRAALQVSSSSRQDREGGAAGWEKMQQPLRRKGGVVLVYVLPSWEKTAQQGVGLGSLTARVQGWSTRMGHDSLWFNR
jgi:hypothetical protein